MCEIFEKDVAVEDVPMSRPLVKVAPSLPQWLERLPKSASPPERRLRP